MLSSKSCFIDAIHLITNIKSKVLANRVKDLSEVDPDEIGYHPSLVNIVLSEGFDLCISEVSILPTDCDGLPIADAEKTKAVATKWFADPEFCCVVQGKLPTGEEHAVAYINQRFIDPREPETLLENPPVAIRSLWILGSLE